MATRIYLPEGSVSTSPAVYPDGTWTEVSIFDTAEASLTKTGTALTTKTHGGVISPPQSVLFRIYTLPLAAGVVFATTDTFKGRVLVKEGTTADNQRSQCVIMATDSAGVPQAYLVAPDSGALVSEWFHTSLRNIQIPRGASVPVFGNYTTLTAGFLQIELGFYTHAAGAYIASSGMRFGDTGATDLPENETDTVTTKVPWIEFSGSLSPPAAVSGAARTFVLF